ncbi:MAG: restriction endonuclease subunit S [Prevotella sp.]|nr:restriction endonuclease subunit S [Prevotella sp.]
MVEWKKLGEVCEILDSQRKPVSKGKRVQGIFPYYGANGIQDYVDKYIFDGTFLLLGEDGSVKNEDNTPVLHWATGKIWVNNHAHILKECDGYILRYIYYSLQCVDVSDIVRGVPPKISQANMRNILIPIPSLEEQERIVGILDTFTASIGNIKAQIEQRRKQYEHYRNTLLTFNKDDDSVEWKTLGEIGDISAGGDVPRNTIKETNPIENYCFPVYSNGKENNSLYGYSTSYSIEKQAVTISARGTIGWHCVREAYFTPIIRLITVIPDEKLLSAKYLDYALYVTRIGGDNGGIPQLTVPSIKNCEIPLPSLQEQQRIVSILDTFEASITNLEAQLEQRQKQYEYYREELLTNLS